MDIFGDPFSTGLFVQKKEEEKKEDEEDKKIRSLPMIEAIKRLPTKNPTKSALERMQKRDEMKQNKNSMEENKNSFEESVNFQSFKEKKEEKKDEK